MVQSRKRKSAGSDSPEKEEEKDKASVETPRDIANDANIEDKQTLASVFEVEDYAIILLDPSGKILSWNRGG